MYQLINIGIKYYITIFSIDQMREMLIVFIARK